MRYKCWDYWWVVHVREKEPATTLDDDNFYFYYRMYQPHLSASTGCISHTCRRLPDVSVTLVDVYVDVYNQNVITYWQLLFLIMQ